MKTKSPHQSEVLDRFVHEATRAIRRQGLEYNLLVHLCLGAPCTFEAMQFDTGAGYGYAARIFKKENPVRMAVGFERFCNKKQGVKFTDAITVAYWDSERWHLGIMEYEHSPAKVHPINWANKYWTDILRDELEGVRIIKPTGDCRMSENRKHKWQPLEGMGREHCVNCLIEKPIK